MESNKRRQLELLDEKTPQGPHVEPVTPQLVAQIKRRRTFTAAWNFAQHHACLEDKQCYGPLGMDGSHWGKISNELANPPGDARMTKYMDIVRNEIPLIWLVEARGYDWFSLRPHQTQEQQVIAEQAARIQELEATVRNIVAAQTTQRGKP